MIALRISINGQYVCTCSAEVLTAIVTLNKLQQENLTLDVGGLQTSAGNSTHSKWIDHPLTINDEITIKVV